MADEVWVRLQARYAQLYTGELKVEDLSDEELARGRLKASDGTWRGRPPKMVPAQLIQAMRKEWLGRAESRLRSALMDSGIGTLVELAADKTIDPGVRLRAAQTIMDRTMGKVPDKVTISADDPVEALFRAVLSDPFGLAPHEPSAEERAKKAG